MQGEGEVALPPDLVARGFVLIARAPGRLFAVSERYGGTHVKESIDEVVAGARALVGYIEWREQKERDNAADSG